MNNEELVLQLGRLIEAFGGASKRFDDSIKDLYDKLDRVRTDIASLQTEVAVDDHVLTGLTKIMEGLEQELRLNKANVGEKLREIKAQLDAIAKWITAEDAKQAEQDKAAAAAWKHKVLTVLIEIAKLLGAGIAGGGASKLLG